MQEKKPTKNYEDLPDTIDIKDYMEWRGCGRANADAVFHAKGFPLIPNSNKQIADKRAVLLYELRLTEEQMQVFLKALAQNIIQNRTIVQDVKLFKI